MRHRVAGKKLGRTRQQRKALFKSLISSLILHHSIETTEGKAKTIRPIVEKLVTKARSPELSHRRDVQSFLQHQAASTKLIRDIAPAFQVTSGFTRLIRTRRRLGDNAQLMKLEWSHLQSPEQKQKPASKKSRKSAPSP